MASDTKQKDCFDWASQMRFPDKKEIAQSNKSKHSRSPYLSGWALLPQEMKYDRITVAIRSDHLPRATYCCAANFILDYSSLEKRYEKVRTEYGIGGYAGLQHNLKKGQYNAILSFWDVICTDSEGKETTIRAKQLYPEPGRKSTSFSGEGTGAHARPDYDWKEHEWYILRLICSTLENGNTAIELTACRATEENEEMLCKFDLGVPDVTFKGNVAFFLENFDPSAAGEVRSMALHNYVVRLTDGSWASPRAALCSSRTPEYRGSGSFFTGDDVIGMITTGVPGCAPEIEKSILYFSEKDRAEQAAKAAKAASAGKTGETGEKPGGTV